MSSAGKDSDKREKARELDKLLLQVVIRNSTGAASASDNLPTAQQDEIGRILGRPLEEQETDQLSKLSEQLMAFLQLRGNIENREESQTTADSSQIDRSISIDRPNQSIPTALHIAIQDGETQLALELLSNGANIDALDDEGNTLLMIAVTRSQFDCVVMLIEQGADLSVKNRRGFTAADLAFASGALETLKALEMKRASLQFDTAVHAETVLDLVKKNSIECLKYWLENYSKQGHLTEKPYNLGYKDGRTILHAAALTGSEELLLLIEALEGNFDLPDDTKCTPLFYAAQSGSEEVVDFLLEKGCQVNHVSNAGQTPLFAAIINRHEAIIKKLLDAGADILIKDKEGKCPIAHSIESKHQVAFDSLLKKQITIGQDSTRAEGNLVQLAAQLNQYEMLQRLHQVNLPLDVPNKSNKKTALMTACQIGSEEIVTYLLQNGCDASRVDCAGNSPALLAASEGHQQILSILQIRNAKLDEKNALGETAVLVAAKSKANVLETVNFLLLHDCDPNVVDINGNTLASYAASSLNLALLKLLIKQCCQLDIADYKGNTPLMKAIMVRSDADILLSRKFVCKLLQHECRPSVKNNKGNSAISIAAKMGRMDLLTLFAKRDEALLNINRKGKTILMQVAAKNQLAVLPYLERESPDEMDNRNAIDVCGRTAVHFAAMKGHLELLQHLVSKFKCAFDTKDKLGRTPFMLAVKEGNYDAAKWLAKIGADVNLRNNRGENAAHMAAQRGSLSMMKLLERNDCCLDQEDKSGKTPIMIACASRDMALVDFLLSKQVLLDGLTKDNRHSLHFACEAGAFEIVKKLLSLNAAPDISDSLGVTPLMLSALARSSEIAKLLLSKNNELAKAKDKKGKTCLEYALIGDNSDLVCELIEAGCDVKNRQNDGRTPLLVAIETTSKCASDGVAQELLKLDFDKAAVTKDGLNAAHFACKFNKLQVLKILKEKGIPIDRQTKSLDNCLTLAVPNGSSELIALLIDFELDKGHMNENHHSAVSLAYQRADEDVLSKILPVCDAQVSKVYGNGSTLLHLACERGSVKLISSLIDRDETLLHKCNGQSETPLHVACQNSMPESVDILLKRGADPNALDCKDETPIFRIAAGSANLEIYKLLIAHNANLNAINKDGVSVLAAAFHRGNRPAIDLLLSNGAVLSPDSLPESYEIIRENIRTRRNKNVTDLLSRGLSVNRRESNWNILHLALETSRSELVAELLRRGASVAVKDKEGNTPLLTAIRFGQVTFAKQILEQHPETVNDVNNYGDSVLHVAVSAGKLSTLKWLLTSYEFPRNVKNQFEETALHVAAKLGLEDLYNILSASGWDANLTSAGNNRKFSMVELAARSGNRNFAVRLHEKPHDVGVCDSLCSQFAASGQTTALKNMFRYKSCSAQVMSVGDSMIASGNQFLIDWAIQKQFLRVNDRDASGHYLIKAVRIGNYHLCLMFMKKSCSLEVRLSNGFTLVHEAVAVDHEPILRYLIHQGALAKEADSNGETPLLLSASLSRTRLLKVLHGEFGCNLNDRNSRLGQNTAHIAALKGNTKILKYLKKQQMDERFFNEVDLNNETPLILAVRTKSLKCVKALIDSRARINETDQNGRSALNLMLASEDPEIRRFGESLSNHSQRRDLSGSYMGLLHGDTGQPVSAQDRRGQFHPSLTQPQSNTGPISIVRHPPESVDDSSQIPANGATFAFNHHIASATDL